MNDTALSVFGRRGSADVIALVIARALPGSEVAGRGKSFRISVASKRTMFRQTRPDLVIDVDAGRFSGVTADQQRAMVRHQIVRRMRGPGLDAVLAMIPELTLAIPFVPTDSNHSIATTDPTFQVVLDVAARVDGFVLDLRNGRLFSVTGQVWASTELLLAEGGTPIDPSLMRIKGRLITLVAVAARALTEFDGRDLQEARDGITRWVRSVGMSAELEDYEHGVLVGPTGAMDESELTHSSWQIEGAVVLAWALDLLDELPPYDEAIDPTLMSAILRFPDADSTLEVLRSGTRRHQAIIDEEAERHFSIYWRLVEFAANRTPLDLEAYNRTPQAGPLRFERVPLLGGDLAIGGQPIEYAHPDTVDVALCITAERLRALNWLRKGGAYSSTSLEP